MYSSIFETTFGVATFGFVPGVGTIVVLGEFEAFLNGDVPIPSLFIVLLPKINDQDQLNLLTYPINEEVVLVKAMLLEIVVDCPY